MAAPIIAALRRRTDLKESVLHTAQELAHRASIYGVVRVSYTYLAVKCRCSRRTVIRHIQRLIDLRILRKTVLWIRGNCCEVNHYAFLITWEKPAPKGGSDKTARNLPPQEREKNTSLKEELDKQQKWFPNLIPGSIAWESSRDKIAELEGLLAARALPVAGEVPGNAPRSPQNRPEPSTGKPGAWEGEGGNFAVLYGVVDVFRDTREDGSGSGQRDEARRAPVRRAVPHTGTSQ
jgi:Helix-turn-helix domain